MDKCEVEQEMRVKRFDELISAGIEEKVGQFLQQDNDNARIEVNRLALAYINYMCAKQGVDPEPYKKQYLGQIRGD